MQRGRGTYRGRYTPSEAASAAKITQAASVSAATPPTAHPLDKFSINELICRKDPAIPNLKDMKLNIEAMRRKYRYTSGDLQQCLESKRYILFKIIVSIPAKNPIRLRPLMSAISHARDTVELGLIYETHVREICEDTDYYQLFIYMCIVFKDYALVKHILSNHPTHKIAAIAILHGFAWGLDVCRPYTAPSVVEDGRIPVDKFADVLCEIFPEYSSLILCLCGEESYSDEVLTFVLQHKLPMSKIKPSDIPRCVEKLGLNMVYEMIMGNTAAPTFVYDYIELVKLGLDTVKHLFPREYIVLVLDILSANCDLDSIFCMKYDSVRTGPSRKISIIMFILEDKSSTKNWKYVPSEKAKQYIHYMNLEQLVYYMKRGDFTPNLIMNHLMRRNSCNIRIASFDIPYFKTMIDYGLYADPRYKFAGEMGEDIKQDLLRRWFYKRPEDAQTLQCLGLKMDTMEVCPYVNKSATYDIALFGISPELRHAMAFHFPLTRIDQYVESGVNEMCYGVILVYMYRRPQYYLSPLPMDIIRVVHSYFGAI